jgi:hypothetical protein
LLSDIKGKGNYKRSLHEEAERPLLSRVALHASSLTIREFETEAPILIHSDWPKDLAVAIRQLRQWSAVI